MTREPLVTVASLIALITAIIGMFVSFGLDLSNDQQTAIIAAVSVLAPLVVAAVARRDVTPVDDPR